MYLKNALYIVKGYVRKLMKIVALSICMKDTIHVAASRLVNFAMVSYVKELKSSKHSVNYKEDDLFQLENEGMSCDNMFVDYSKTKDFLTSVMKSM